MKWGAEYPERHDLSKLRLLGRVGEPINPKAWLWYCKVIGGERCPIVDTWWQTETGDIMITHAAGRAVDEAGRRAARRCRASTPRVVDEEGKEVDADTQGLLVAAQAVAGDAAHALPRRGPLHRDVLQEVRHARPTSSATPPGATRTATSGSSGASTT